MPREVIIMGRKENGLLIWQWQWTDKGKGTVTKAFFPSVRNRIREKIPIFPEFTTMVTGHGKLRSYLHRFGLTDNPMCPCEEEEEQQQQKQQQRRRQQQQQTASRLIFQCKKLRNQRNEMIKQIKTLVAIGLRRVKHL